LSCSLALPALSIIPLVKIEDTPLYPQSDYVGNAEYQRIWTPEEIKEAGFVYMPCITFIHRWNEPYNPVLKSYTSKSDDLERPMVVKSKMFSPWYIKDDKRDINYGMRRGIHSINDYHYKKDIFKPMILEFMKKNEFHYVYEVRLGDSPCIWEDPPYSEGCKRYNYFFPVFVRGARIPTRV
jgi:hypothetical protein